MITLTCKGDFKNTESFLSRLSKPIPSSILHKYGKIGVKALSSVTPVDTGKTAKSWRYSVESNRNGATISFYNDNNNNGVNIAVILQYGHGTKNGGYVAGRDYINPAIQPIFDDMMKSVWEEDVAN